MQILSGARGHTVVLAVAAVALVGCGRKGREAETPASVSSALAAQMIAEDGVRDVPIRFVQLVDWCTGPSCSPCSNGERACTPGYVTEAQLAAKVAQANRVYAPAGLHFHVERVDDIPMPNLRDTVTERPVSFAEVYPDLARALFIRPDAFAPSDRRTRRDWLMIASAVAQPAHQVLVWIPEVSRGSFGTYPQEGRCLIQGPADLRPETWNLSHELGHYLGLPHAFGSPWNENQWDLKPGYLINPATQRPAVLSDFWDLVYKAGTPNVFFASKEEAAREERFLKTIDGTSVVPLCSNGARCCTTGCKVACQLEGEVRRHGDPGMSGVAISRSEDGTCGDGPNVMSYMPADGTCAVGLSQSQILHIRRGLRWDVPSSTLKGVTGGRPALGRGPKQG